MFPNIGATATSTGDCPGTHLYNQMGTIRNIAKKKYDSLKNGTSTSSPSTQPTKQKDKSETTTTTGDTTTTVIRKPG